MKHATERVEVNVETLQALLERAKVAPLKEADYQALKAALATLGYLRQLLEDRKTTLARLRQILFGASTEKTRAVLNPNPGPKTGPQGNEEHLASAEQKRKGHGRNGAQAYPGATKIMIRHASLTSGDTCPECRQGKVYAATTPGYRVRLVGQAPIGASVYELEKLRCNLCGEVFTAREPEGVGAQKYAASSASMIALLKYGSGLPFHRLERLQESLGIPLPASTQWAIVEESADVVKPAYEELIRQAAQGEVLHNDDTPMKILALMGERPTTQHAEEGDAAASRTGIFTSGIVSTREKRQIALFFTGHLHAGENLAQVLRRRACELGPPIQMCDALSRNLPGELASIVANCLAHGRRKFVEIAQSFPDECRHVLETLGEVYQNDALTQTHGMSREARLSFHQARSAPVMEGLEKWLRERLAQRQVEPNSGLGKAIAYMITHWQKLTLFLRVPGAPLDNNLCERALKKAILHRKNALFYKTENGASVGDVFMSLIHTCQLCPVDPLDYLTTLHTQAEEVARNPQAWMPWNYLQGTSLLRTAPV